MRRQALHAYRTVPHWKETMDRLGLTPADFRGASDLARLPILERADLQRDPERFRSRSIDPSRCLSIRSSGSTGEPVEILRDPWNLFSSMAVSERLRSIIAGIVGRRFGYRETAVQHPRSAGHLARDFCRSRSLFGAHPPVRHQLLSIEEPLEAQIERMNEFRPDVLMAFGSWLDLLAARLLEGKGPFHRPAAIAYGGDAPSADARRALLETFGIPIFSAYQAVEADRIGFECESHLGLHLNDDLHPIRIVDRGGRDAPPGETGEVVVSNLANRATVLLNYRLGDLASRLPGPCPCGRTLPMLSFPVGRRDDFFVDAAGRRIHPQLVIGGLRIASPVRRFRIVQEAVDRIRVSIAASPSFDRAGASARAVAGLQALLPGASVLVEFPEDIPPEKSGKHRPVVRRIEAPPPAGASPPIPPAP